MKKIILTVFLILPFVVHSQNLTKTYLTILDEYIEKEPVRKRFDKDSVFLFVSFFETDEIEDNFGVFISMYLFKHYPHVDSLKIHKGVKMQVRYPKNMEKKLSKYFKSIKDTRKIKEEEITTRYESVSNYLFQINKNNEIYIISTSDDDYYYKKFKEKKLKLSKKMLFSKDLIQVPIEDEDD